MRGEFSPCNWKIRQIRNFRANENSDTKFVWPDRTGSEQDCEKKRSMIQAMGYFPIAYFIAKQ
jgi:hypothetical protein